MGSASALWTKVKAFQNLGVGFHFNRPMPHLDAMKVVDEDRARRLSKQRPNDNKEITLSDSSLELIRMCGWASDVHRKERELAGKGPAYGLQASYLYDEPRLSRLRQDSVALGGPLPNSTLRYVSLPSIASSASFEQELIATKASDTYDAHCSRFREGSNESPRAPQPNPVSHDHQKADFFTASSAAMSARFVLFDRTSCGRRLSAETESPWRRSIEKAGNSNPPRDTPDLAEIPTQTQTWTWRGRKVRL